MSDLLLYAYWAEESLKEVFVEMRIKKIKKKPRSDAGGQERQINQLRRGNSCFMTLCNATSLKIKASADAKWIHSFERRSVRHRTAFSRRAGNHESDTSSCWDYKAVPSHSWNIKCLTWAQWVLNALSDLVVCFQGGDELFLQGPFTSIPGFFLQT